MTVLPGSIRQPGSTAEKWETGHPGRARVQHGMVSRSRRHRRTNSNRRCRRAWPGGPGVPLRR